MVNNQGGRRATTQEDEIELRMEQLRSSVSQVIEAAVKCIHESAGESGFSIVRVPQALAGEIARASQPLIVSIGPYHCQKSRLEMFQKHKLRCLRTMLDQIQPYGVGLKDLVKTVAARVETIQQCYWESTECFSGADLVKMMVVDGCFIMQFLRQSAGVIQKDPALRSSYVLNAVARDILRLENQVPHFVLEDLFETTNVPKGTLSLADLAFQFFERFDVGPGDALRQNDLKGVHLLDSFRLSLIPLGQQDILIPLGQQDSPGEESSYGRLIRSASELRRVGIGFRLRQASSFLEIKFDSRSRTIEIPEIAIDDDLNCILPNMVAFEQCCGQTNGHATAYAAFMGCLIHTADDVQLLRGRNIISNHGRSNDEVAHFFGEVCKNASVDVHRNYLASHFSILNKSFKYERAYLCWAQLLNAFRDNPWSALSGLAVLVTLVGIIQTVYAVLQYHSPK